jgi:hypothetical protein
VWYWHSIKSRTGTPLVTVSPRDTSPAPPTPIIINKAGDGGSVTNINGGIGFGGPGGTFVNGGQGRGGDGGGGVANGPGSSAGGGQGGSVGSDRYWPHPAKNGYETFQRAQGLPVAPGMRAWGRGGAVAGYEPKLAVVEQLRDKYFAIVRMPPKSYFEDINAVPLDYLNESLADMGEPWRVKIVDTDEYDFYIP